MNLKQDYVKKISKAGAAISLTSLLLGTPNADAELLQYPKRSVQYLQRLFFSEKVIDPYKKSLDILTKIYSECLDLYRGEPKSKARSAALDTLETVKKEFGVNCIDDTIELAKTYRKVAPHYYNVSFYKDAVLETQRTCYELGYNVNHAKELAEVLHNADPHSIVTNYQKAVLNLLEDMYHTDAKLSVIGKLIRVYQDAAPKSRVSAYQHAVSITLQTMYYTNNLNDAGLEKVLRLTKTYQEAAPKSIATAYACAVSITLATIHETNANFDDSSMLPVIYAQSSPWRESILTLAECSCNTIKAAKKSGASVLEAIKNINEYVKSLFFLRPARRIEADTSKALMRRIKKKK